MAENVIIPGEEDAENIIIPEFELGNEYSPGTPIAITNPKEKVIILPSGGDINGGLSSGEANSRYVRYDLPQNLTEVGKAQARSNIGIVGTGPHSSGMVVEPGLTDNGDGTVNVLSEDANIYKTNDWTGGLFVYTIPSLGNIQLTDNTTNYIIVNYNSGSPAYQTTTNVAIINESNIIPVFTIERIGLKLRLLPWDALANGKSDRMHARFVKTRRFERDSNEGLAVSEFGTRNLRIETGRVWYGANTIDLSLVLSTVNDFEQYFNVGGVWNLGAATQWNNTQFDDGTDLQTMTAGKFGVIWLYRGVEVDSHGLMVLGNQEYDTEAEARTAGIRADLPSSINTNSMLVSQLIFLKDAATLSDIRSPFNTIFTSANPTSHNSLAGLQLAGSGITYGHIDDQAQNIVGAKTFSDIVSSPNFQSTVVTGTEPYATNSVTLNTNLNADLLDGKHATEFAAFDYLDNVDNIQQVPLNYLDTDVLLTANSDVKVATQRATKTYVNGLVDGTLKAPEPYNPTITSAFPTTYGGDPIEKGDSFRITAAGTMNGVIVNPEDLLIALIDLPGNTPSNWQVVESNRDQATEVTLGVAKIATQVQVDAGTDNLSFVTSLKLQTKLNTDLANVAYTNQANVFTENQSITKNSDGSNGLTVSNNSSGSSSRAAFVATNGVAGGEVAIYRAGENYTGVSSWQDAGVITTGSQVGKLVIRNGNATGKIEFQGSAASEIGNIDNVGNIDFISYSIGGTTVIDASRNIVNAGSGSFGGTLDIISPIETHLALRRDTSPTVDFSLISNGGNATYYHTQRLDRVIDDQKHNWLWSNQNSVDNIGMTLTGDNLNVTGTVTASNLSGTNTGDNAVNSLYSGLVSNVTTNLSTTHNASTVVINSSDGTNATINAATASLAGVVTNTTQTFGGAKTFNSTVTASGGLSVTGHAGITGTLTSTGDTTLSTNGIKTVAATSVGASSSGVYTLSVGANTGGSSALFEGDILVNNGTATATNFILSSDERLKTFKDESIVDVSSIAIRKFTYNNDETKRDRYGVSAQELQKVAPEMVYVDTDEDKTLRVGYIDFLLAEVHNLRQRLNKLEA